MTCDFVGTFMNLINFNLLVYLFLLQAVTMRRYPAHLSLTAIVCFLGTLQSIAVTFVMEHKASVWTIGWDMNLLAAAYAVSLSLSLSLSLFTLFLCFK